MIETSVVETTEIATQDLNQLVDDWQQQLVDQTPQQILSFALKQFKEISLSFSGAEDVVLIHMASQITSGVKVFTLDTGRLHPETYQYIDLIRKTYPISLSVAFPEPEAVQQLVNEKGLFSFYQDGHQECCGVRKVAPLRKQLNNLEAWVTGQRQDQSPGTRQNVPVVQIDRAFSTAESTLIKFNPLAHWSSAQTWAYIQEENIPYNPLHAKGFISIGCEPCTNSVLPNQHERAGRWSWEEATQKECGLHSANIKS